MQNVKLAVFAYNFPHKKTQDFLLRLYLEGYPVDCVIANEWIRIDSQPTIVRSKINHIAVLHPQKVANRLGIEFLVLPHDSRATVELIQNRQIDLGIVAGARIIEKNTIDAFKIGIINFHPGLIPEVRGLDAMLWSIYEEVPLGVSCHLIDHRIDAGRLLLKEEIKVFADDTLLDLSERLYETQLEMINRGIESALRQQGMPVTMTTPYHKKMPHDVELITVRKLPEYLRRFAQNQ